MLSWDDFISRLSEFERKIKEEKDRLGERIQAMERGHPILDEVMRKSVPLLPPPLNLFAQVIYDTFDETKKDLALQDVLKFLNCLKNDGKSYFYQISYRLENLESTISRLENGAARQDALLKIKDILGRKEDSVNYKLDTILNEIREQNDRPTLEFAGIFVEDNSFPRNGKHVKVLDYLLRVSKSGGNGTAKRCEVFIDVPGTDIRSFEGIWPKKTGATIDIGTYEEVRLFQILHNPPDLDFWSHGYNVFLPDNDETGAKEVIVRIQSENAITPSEQRMSIRQIKSSAAVSFSTLNNTSFR